MISRWKKRTGNEKAFLPDDKLTFCALMAVFVIELFAFRLYRTLGHRVNNTKHIFCCILLLHIYDITITKHKSYQHQKFLPFLYFIAYIIVCLFWTGQFIFILLHVEIIFIIIRKNKLVKKWSQTFNDISYLCLVFIG